MVLVRAAILDKLEVDHHSWAGILNDIGVLAKSSTNLQLQDVPP